MNSSLNRRDFLKKSTVAGIGLSLAPQFFSRAGAADAPRTIGANDKIVVAVIGTNGRGLAHVGCLTGLPGTQIAYICDVDDRAIAKGIKAHDQAAEDRAEGR